MVSHRNLLPHLRSFDKGNEKHILVKAPNPRRNNDSDSVTMPTSFMTGLIVGKRFYKKVMTREADDGNGWAVWAIADAKRQGYLGFKEFIVAMQSGEASALFVNSGGTRAIVELLGAFLETLIKETGCQVSSMKLLYMQSLMDV
ncbi:hypothetical protein YC2023_057480 [Brassica napus]